MRPTAWLIRPNLILEIDSVMPSQGIMPKTAQVLEEMRTIALRPSMYGTPESVSGLITAFAAVVLSEELQLPIARSWHTLRDLVCEATKDVLRPPSQGIELCHEGCYPDLRVSYEAFSEHTVQFLSLLEDFVNRAKVTGSGP